MPVRKAEGTVPRQRNCTGLGVRKISWNIAGSELLADCWSRVLSRSAGCKSTAEKTPEVRPAKKLHDF